MLLFIGFACIVILLMYKMGDMPDWSKTHHDHKKGSYYEISNRK